MNGTIKKAGAGLATLVLAAGMAFAQAPAQDQTQPPQQGQMQGHREWHGKHMGRGGFEGGGFGMGGGFMGHLAKKLNITDQQKQQIKSIFDAEKPTIQPLRDQLKTGRQQLLAATANGKFDQAQVQSIANQQGQTMAQLMVEMSRVQSKIYNTVLTPEQRTQVDQMKANWASGQGQHRGMRHQQKGQQPQGQ